MLEALSSTKRTKAERERERERDGCGKRAGLVGEYPSEMLQKEKQRPWPIPYFSNIHLWDHPFVRTSNASLRPKGLVSRKANYTTHIYILDRHP